MSACMGMWRVSSASDRRWNKAGFEAVGDMGGLEPWKLNAAAQAWIRARESELGPAPKDLMYFFRKMV